MNKEETKAQAIKEYLSGEISTRSLGAKYGYSRSSISRWIMADKKQSEKEQLLLNAKIVSGKEEEMPEDVKELQEALRISRIKNHLLEAMIDIADEQLGTQIRKKVGPRQS